MSIEPASTIDWTAFDAVLFDLDGVLTSTARLHAAAWKRTFDEFLADRHPPSQAPFDIDSDYRAYVDGRPRFDGVATFLESRDIHLPWGDPGDPPGWDTVCAIGNSKNEMVTAILRSEGVEVYPGSLDLLDYLAPIGVALAVVSASANA
ncbi:MAG: HAD family hydrolase, partial [Acidimicrobiia bacterium]